MGLQKQRERLVLGLELSQRKESFLLDVVQELSRLMLLAVERCRHRAGVDADCACDACQHVYARFAAFNHGLQALMDEEKALLAKFGGPRPPVVAH